MALLLLAWSGFAVVLVSRAETVVDSRESLVIRYVRDCKGVDEFTPGHPCVAYAEDAYRAGPEVLGRRIAWLHAASLYQGIADSTQDLDLLVFAATRATGIYREVLESFPNDGVALKALASRQVGREARIEAYEEIVRLRPIDHLAWWSLAYALSPKGLSMPSRRALEAMIRAWQLARSLNFGFKFQYAGGYIGLLGAIEGQEVANAALESLREGCGVSAALGALQGRTGNALGERLGAAADVRELYCDSAYRYFDPVPCELAQQELERLVGVHPDSFEALLELARLLEILHTVPGFDDPHEGCAPWTRSVDEQRLDGLYTRMLELRPASFEARWRRAARLCQPARRLRAMEEIGWVTDDLPADFRLALAHELLNADRPADTVRQTEQVLEQSLVEEERYYAWALLVDAHTAQQDWVAAARLLIAEGYPAKWYDGTLEDPITNGPRCE